MILLNLAALIFGGTALFSKIIPLPAVDIIFFRGAFAAFFLGLYLLLFKRKLLKIDSLQDLIWLLIAGLFFGIHLATYFYAIQVSNVGVAVISLFTFPMITSIVEPFIVGHKLKIKDIVVGVLTFIGVFFIVDQSEWNASIYKGVGYGLLSAITYGLRNLVLKYKLSSYSPIPLLFYQLFVTAILMSFLISIEFKSIEPKDYGLLILLTLVFTILPHLAVLKALQKFEAKSVGFILTLQVLYAIFFAYLFIGEKLEFSLIFGAVLIIGVVSYETISLRLKEVDLIRKFKILNKIKKKN